MPVSTNLQNFSSAVSNAEEACRLAERGRIDEAMALFKRAVELCPNEGYIGNLRIMRGAVLMEECQAEASLADFNVAIEKGCSYPHEAYRRRGNALAALGRYEEALADFRQALEEGEDTAYGYERITGMLVALGRDDEAMQEPFEDLDGAADAQRRLLLGHAELCLLHGEREAAEACIEKAEQIEGADDSELGLWRAVLRKRLGLDPETAVIQKAIEAWPKSNAARVYALLIKGEGEPADAFDRFGKGDRPSSRAVTRCVLHYFAGGWYEAAGDTQAAKSHYQSAISNPDARWATEFSLANRGLARIASDSDRVVVPFRKSKIPVVPLRVVSVTDIRSDAFNEQFKRSIDVMNAGRGAEAIAMLDRLIEGLPVSRGLSTEFTRMALELSYIQRSAFRKKTGDTVGSLADLRHSNRYSRDPSEGIFDLLVALGAAGDCQGAREELDRHEREEDPHGVFVPLMRGAIHFAEGNVQPAASDLDTALRRAPGSANIQAVRALLHLAEGNPGAAATLIQRARREDSESLETALAYYVIDQKISGEGFSVGPLDSDAEPAYQAALIRHMVGEVDQETVLAAIDGEDESQRRHQLTIAYYYLGAVASARGDTATARDAFEAAMEKGLPHLIQFGMARCELASLNSANG